MAEIRIISTRFKQIRKYKDEKITTLLGLIVVGGVKLQILGKIPQFYLIIMRELPKSKPSILKNLDILL